MPGQRRAVDPYPGRRGSSQSNRSTPAITIFGSAKRFPWLPRSGTVAALFAPERGTRLGIDVGAKPRTQARRDTTEWRGCLTAVCQRNPGRRPRRLASRPPWRLSFAWRFPPSHRQSRESRPVRLSRCAVSPWRKRTPRRPHHLTPRWTSAPLPVPADETAPVEEEESVAERGSGEDAGRGSVRPRGLEAPVELQRDVQDDAPRQAPEPEKPARDDAQDSQSQRPGKAASGR